MVRHKVFQTTSAPQFDDAALNLKVKRLQTSIKKWAQQKELWTDCWFKSWIGHYDSPPHEHNPCAFLLCFEGGLFSLFNGFVTDLEGLIPEFNSLIEVSDFEWEMIDHTTIGFWARETDLQRAFAEMLKWHWTSSLIAPEYSLIHESIFAFFSTNDGKPLQRLTPRNFEVYLDSLFQNRGYRTELGSGTADGGVDIRLYSSAITGDILTLVQAKRYAPSRPIRLEAVQALTAAVDYEPADRGLFVTTSRFLPSAKRFAERKAKHIALLAGEDILRLSKSAAQDLEKSRAALVKPDTLMKLISSKTNTEPDGQVFLAHTGYNIIDNEFALCVKSSAGAALLCPLPKIEHSHDGYHQRGHHVPDVSLHAITALRPEGMFMAKVRQSKRDGSLYLWGDKKLYALWDGQPAWFDSCD